MLSKKTVFKASNVVLFNKQSSIFYWNGSKLKLPVEALQLYKYCPLVFEGSSTPLGHVLLNDCKYSITGDFFIYYENVVGFDVMQALGYTKTLYPNITIKPELIIRGVAIHYGVTSVVLSKKSNFFGVQNLGNRLYLKQYE